MKHKERIEQAIKALQERTFYAPYPENPKAYDAEADAQGKEAFQKAMSNSFVGLNDDGNTGFIGEEVQVLSKLGTLTIGRRGHHQLNDVLHVPAALHKLHRQPVQKFGMGRPGALGTQIVQNGRQPLSKKALPQPVHHNPSR